MGSVGSYLTGITAVAIIGGICTSLISVKHPHGTIIRAVSGIMLALSVISPLASLKLKDFTVYFDDLNDATQQIVSNGETAANNELRNIIKMDMEAYIYDKAKSLGLDVVAEVILSDTNPPTPERILIQGSASAYNKKRLIHQICDDFAIPEECLIWN